MVSHLTLNNGTLSLGLEIRLLSHPSIASMLFQDWKKRRFGSSVTRLGDYWMILVANVLTKVVQNVKNTLWAILKTSILKWKMSCLLFGATYGLVGKLFIVAAGRTDWKHDLYNCNIVDVCMKRSPRYRKDIWVFSNQLDRLLCQWTFWSRTRDHIFRTHWTIFDLPHMRCYADGKLYLSFRYNT